MRERGTLPCVTNPDRLTALDAAFLHIETGEAHMHVASIMVFEGEPPAYEDVKAALDERLHLVPRYRQKLAWVPLDQGRPVWVDDPHFNLGYHVRHSALPAPGSDEQLAALGGRVFAVALDRHKPLWEIHLVEGLAPGPDGTPRFAMIAKTHHALVDGISGVDITSVLFSTTPDPMPVAPPAAHWIPRPEPTGVQLLAEALMERASSPAEGVRVVRALGRAPRTVVRRASAQLAAAGSMAWAGMRGAPPTPLNVPIGPHRRYGWVDTPLDLLKGIKNGLGGTVNDAVLTTVALALGRFLRRRGFETEGLVLKVLVPVSVRSTDQRGALGNQVSAMWAPLPMDEDDPQACFERIHTEMGDLKESGQAVGAEVAHRHGGLRAADGLQPGGAPAGPPALLQPRRHERPRPADPAVPARAPDGRDPSRRPARADDGPGHRDHELLRAPVLRPDGRLRRAAGPRRPDRRPGGRAVRPRPRRRDRAPPVADGRAGRRAHRPHARDAPAERPAARAPRPHGHTAASMRIALAQINPLVGDVEGNERLVRTRLLEAREAGAQIVLFPELALTGYPPEDLLLKEHLLADVARGAGAARGRRDGHRRRRRLPRARAGRLQRRRRARGRRRAGDLPQEPPAQLRRLRRAPLLPARPVRRRSIDVDGVAVGMTICEDIWVPGPAASDEALAGARLIVNISASPYLAGKGLARERMIGQRARDELCAIAFCALVGGQDELVFDGHSFVVDHTGAVIARAPQFEEALTICSVDVTAAGAARLRDTRQRAAAYEATADVERLGAFLTARPGYEADPPSGAVAPPLDAEAEVYGALVLGTRDYVRKNGFEHVVLGLSGGDRLRARRLRRRRRARAGRRHLRDDALALLLGGHVHRRRRARRDASGVTLLELPIADVMAAYEAQLAERVRGHRSPTSPRRTCRRASAATS